MTTAWRSSAMAAVELAQDALDIERHDAKIEEEKQ
jgi:galactokinase/mevalonate kinase-like predicted kinase